MPLKPLNPQDIALLREWLPDLPENLEGSPEAEAAYLERPDIVDALAEDQEMWAEAKRQCQQAGLPLTPENVSTLFDSLQKDVWRPK